MKIVFFGTSEFAEEPLKGLIGTDHVIEAVVTQPDRPSGRGRKLLPPPVKRVAVDSRIRVLQPEDPNSRELIAELRRILPDLIVVVAYAHKLGAELLGLPRYGCVNVHPSLLPRYRGAAPVNWAIIRGETRTGVTIMKMNERFDAGEILTQEAVQIEELETAGELSDRLSILGSSLLIVTLEAIGTGRANPRQQQEEEVTRAPRIKKADCEVDWSRSALQIHNLIRGLYPKPGAFGYFRDKLVKFSRSKVVSRDTRAEQGRIVGLEDGIEVATGEGTISLLRLQPENKREMSWQDFRNGLRPELGERMGG